MLILLTTDTFDYRREYQKLLQDVASASADGELSTEARDSSIRDNLTKVDNLFE